MIPIRYMFEYGNYQGKPSKWLLQIKGKAGFAHITDAHFNNPEKRFCSKSEWILTFQYCKCKPASWRAKLTKTKEF